MARILHIDDQDHYRADLCFVLEEEGGFETLNACNAIEALDLIQNEKPDLILCDVKMPGISGFELIRQVKLLSGECSKIPFIFLTGLTDKNDIIKGTTLGPDDYLIKPVELDVLIAKINVAIERTKQQQSEHQNALFALERLGGRVELKDEQTNVSKLIEEVTARVKQVDHNKFRPVFVDIESQLPDIILDRQCFSKMLYTILTQLTNALPRKERVTIAARQDYEDGTVFIIFLAPDVNEEQLQKITTSSFVEDVLQLQKIHVHYKLSDDKSKITITIPPQRVME